MRHLLRALPLMLLALPAWADDETAAFREDVLSGAATWDEIEARARDEGRVVFHYWGGSDLLNVWIDREVAPAMAERGIELVPVRITGTKDSVDLILGERAAGRGPGEGSVDVIWVNGENFAALKAQDALFGDVVGRLPNAANLDLDPASDRSGPNLRDFGVPTGGTEVPWSGEQYVCAYDSARRDADALPRDMADLEGWVEANPGRFTYVRPPHYLGNTFVQAAAYALNPDGTGAEPFQRDAATFEAAELARLLAPAMEMLRAIEPNLAGGSAYPEDEAALDGMFLNGQVDFACKFGLYAVATGLATGTMPEGARQFVFPEGAMIRNKNFLAIPDTAPHPAAALVLADWMTGIEAQAGKLRATGFPAGIDPWMLSDDEAARIAEAAPGLVGVTHAELDANAAPDTNATLVEVIQAVWADYVLRRSDAAFEEIVADALAAAR